MLNQLPLTFLLSFCRDKIPGKGEDSFCYSFCDSAGMLGVFDGCGGAGARTHAYYSGKTEAYMASRLCAGAFYDLFRMHYPEQQDTAAFVRDVLQPGTLEQLSRFHGINTLELYQIAGLLNTNLLHFESLAADPAAVKLTEHFGIIQPAQDLHLTTESVDIDDLAGFNKFKSHI